MEKCDGLLGVLDGLSTLYLGDKDTFFRKNRKFRGVYARSLSYKCFHLQFGHFLSGDIMLTPYATLKC